jgi:S-DNA-T family DNA segregation ATPase FtsK/SpoIIIE
MSDIGDRLPAVREAPSAGAIAVTAATDTLNGAKDRTTWHLKHPHKDAAKLLKNAWWGFEHAAPRFYKHVMAHDMREDARNARAVGNSAAAMKAEDKKWFRLIVRGTIYVIAPAIALYWLTTLYDYRLVLSVTGLVLLVIMAVIGARLTGDTIIERAVIDRDHWWTEEAINKALRLTKVLPPIKKDEPPVGIRIVTFPFAVDGGKEVKFTLPQEALVTANKLQLWDEKLAAQFNVATTQVLIEEGSTAAEVVLWVADDDPLREDDVRPSHLLTAKRTSMWEDAVLGRDVRGRDVSTSLMWTQFIVGGLQGMGKSTVVRLLLGHALLDPDCDIYLLNFKGGNDYRRRIREVVRGYVNGSDEEHLKRALHILHSINEERRRRFQIIEDNEDDFPDGKITPESAAKYGFRPVLLIMDEIQEAFAALYGTPEYKELEGVLQSILRLTRALGISPGVSTQRPDEDALPAKLKGLFGKRIALKCADRQSSENILGQGASARGNDASKLPETTGVGIFVAGGAVGTTLRFDNITSSEFEKLVEKGIQLRSAANVNIVNDEDAPTDLVATARMILEAHDGEIAPADMLSRVKMANPALWNDLSSQKLGRAMKDAGLHEHSRNGVKYVLKS